MLQDEAQRILHEDCFPRLLPHQIPDEPKDPRFPELDKFQILCTVIQLTPKEVAEQQAAQQPPHSFLPPTAAAPGHQYGQQLPPPMQMQPPGGAGYPPGGTPGALLQQPGFHGAGPHQYPGPGQIGLQHQLPQGLPRPAAPPVLYPGAVPAAPSQVSLSALHFICQVWILLLVGWA